jgi:DNA-binding transcriptional regulator YdaS (Cro superfamily)
MEDALQEAIRRVGGLNAVARALDIKAQSVIKWRVTPPLRVIPLEKLSGVSRHRLRPDIYPADKTATAASR